MKIISVVSQKGGAGKTTIATNLAVLAERAGYPTVLFDLDPQATAAKWGDKRDGTPPDVVAAQAGRLGRLLEEVRQQGAGLVIIDTAPTADNAALEATKVADLVLVPCQPSDFDLENFKRGLRHITLPTAYYNKREAATHSSTEPKDNWGLLDDAK